MPVIRERDPDLVYTRAERENNWAAFLVVMLLLLTLGVFAFLMLARDNDRQALMDQIDQLRLQQQTQPPVTQQVPIPIPQPVPVPVTQPVPQPIPIQIPVPTPSASERPETPAPAPSTTAPSSPSNNDTSGDTAGTVETP